LDSESDLIIEMNPNAAAIRILKFCGPNRKGRFPDFKFLPLGEECKVRLRCSLVLKPCISFLVWVSDHLSSCVVWNVNLEVLGWRALSVVSNYWLHM